MKNRRFVLIVTDSTGRWIKRVGVARRSIEIVVLGAAIFVVASVAMLIHGVVRHERAVESVQLARDNEHLKDLLEQLNGGLEDIRRWTRRAEMSFAQLSSKSGLGVEPGLLGAGPFELDDSDGIPTATQDLIPAVNGELLALDPIALPLELERIGNDGVAVQYTLSTLLEYLHDAERLLSHTPSIRPTHSNWITSGFGRRRDPINQSWLMHKGLDLGGTTGMEIFAPADGIVIFTGRRGGYGMTVVLHHGFGLQTHFAHLSSYRVKVGDRVRRGQVIAEMGSTGKSTGPHLHYEVRRNGEPLDPQRFVLD